MSEIAPDLIRLSVAICTRNRLSSLRLAVESVLPQLLSSEELLIIDNGSSDGTAEWLTELARRNDQVRVFKIATPGISQARNLALRSAQHEFLVSLDDDEVAEPDWLETYRRFLSDNCPTRFGCVGGPYLPRHEIRVPVWLHKDFGGFDLGIKCGPIQAPLGPAGGNCLFNREAALTVGGFSGCLTRHEDTDMNNRLRDAGYAVWWLPEARIQHLIPAARLKFSWQLCFWFREGHTTAQLRLLQRPTFFSRMTFRLSRILITPFQTLAQMTGSLGFLVALRRVGSARLAFRAARSLGLFSRLWY